MSGSDGALTFDVTDGEWLWLVVVGAPTEMQQIVWDTGATGPDRAPYHELYRFPYMVELAGAWPDGFEGGELAPCASGERHENGGGCAPADLPASVYVGPYAQVLGGNVSGDARIEDHAVILGGTVSGGSGGAVSVGNDPGPIDDVTVPPPYTWRP